MTNARPMVHQELRRWRSEAAAEINTNTDTDRSRPAVPSPTSKAPISGRTSSHSPLCPSLPPSSQLHGMPPPSLPAVHRGDSEVTSTRGGTLAGSERANQTNTSTESQAFRTTGGRGWRGSGDGDHNNRVTRGGRGGEATRQAEESNGELDPRGTIRREAQGGAQRTLPASDRQHEHAENCFVDGAGVTSAGRHWRGFDSNGHGKGAPIGGNEGLGEASRPVEEEKGRDNEKDDATELSLDLSDCSDEVGHKGKG